MRKFPGVSLNSVGFSGNVINYCARSNDGSAAVKINKVLSDKVPNRGSVLGIGLNTI